MTTKIKFEKTSVEKIKSVLGDKYEIKAYALGGLAIHNLSNSLASVSYDYESNEFYITTKQLNLNIQQSNDFQKELVKLIEKIKTLNEIVKQ